MNSDPTAIPDLTGKLPNPGQPGCPRRTARMAGRPVETRPRLRWTDCGREPFRLFFPAATLAGLLGVALWPALLLGWTDVYPGPSHIRLMVQGFFGGFIFGFLGTSMPRLLEVPPLAFSTAGSLLALFAASVTAQALGFNTVGDALFVVELAAWAAVLLRRWPARKSLPPPTFVLVALSLACAAAGTILQWRSSSEEMAGVWETLGRLLAWHGFPLLAILGAGGFLLPRFLGLGVRRRYPDTLPAQPAWKRAAALSAAVGFLILATYVAEAFGGNSWLGLLRAGLAIGYLAWEMPIERLRLHLRGAQWLLALGIFCIPLGLAAAALFPTVRSTLLHLELVGGFAFITLAVATRVIHGHSGTREQLERPCPGLNIAAALLWIGLLTRLSGGFKASIQQSHYLYGALLWLIGLGLWAALVLPKVLRPDPEP